MSRKQLKFILGPSVIVLTLVWIGYSAFQETGAYFQTVSEMYAMADTLDGKRLKVAGEVVPGTIEMGSDQVEFVITEGGETLTVSYVGRDPLPDTFRDYAEAIVDGEYDGAGVFVATKLQAKCASKYEREAEAGVFLPETTQLDPSSAPTVGNGL
jgi:cytochrome c-type biogenesis protein CcmE